MMMLAATKPPPAGPAWAGETIGLVAAAIFVVFFIWIVVQRLRRNSPKRGDRDG